MRQLWRNGRLRVKVLYEPRFDSVRVNLKEFNFLPSGRLLFDLEHIFCPSGAPLEFYRIWMDVSSIKNWSNWWKRTRTKTAPILTYM